MTSRAKYPKSLDVPPITLGTSLKPTTKWKKTKWRAWWMVWMQKLNRMMPYQKTRGPTSTLPPSLVKATLTRKVSIPCIKFLPTTHLWRSINSILMLTKRRQMRRRSKCKLSWPKDRPLQRQANCHTKTLSHLIRCKSRSNSSSCSYSPSYWTLLNL